MTRTLKRLLDGKTTPAELVTRLDMEAFCSLAAPPNATHVRSHEGSSCIYYELPAKALTRRERDILWKAKHGDGMVAAGFANRIVELTMPAARVKVLRHLTNVQAGVRISDYYWQILKRACDRIDGKQREVASAS